MQCACDRKMASKQTVSQPTAIGQPMLQRTKTRIKTAPNKVPPLDPYWELHARTAHMTTIELNAPERVEYPIKEEPSPQLPIANE